ncbi:MAG TPA: hypothetical protein VH985_13815 [Candidatus Binatia bacterium]|jgi:hypothetical protein
MSKILIIEPYKILRHAFAIALSNAHPVEIVTTIPDAGTLLSADLVIVDAAALRQQNTWTEQGIGAVQNRKLPTIWIDFDGKTPVLAEDRLRRFKWPLEKDTLRKAVAECLGRIDGASPLGPKTAKEAEAPASTKRRSTELTPLRSVPGAEKKVIELVDVVE